MESVTEYFMNNLSNPNMWLLFLSVFAIKFLIYYKIGKPLQKALNQKSIEIDGSEIRIKSKTTTTETINLAEVDKLTVKEKYAHPQGPVTELKKDAEGKGITKNYIIVHQNNEERKLDFEFESFYMISQLIKVIDSWKQKGYPVEYSV